MENPIEFNLRKKISDYAKNGATEFKHGAMCKTCAFKFNSEANLEPHNVRTAFECLAYGNTFNCHIKSGENKGCECVGFKYAKDYLNTFEKSPKDS